MTTITVWSSRLFNNFIILTKNCRMLQTRRPDIPYKDLLMGTNTMKMMTVELKERHDWKRKPESLRQFFYKYRNNNTKTLSGVKGSYSKIFTAFVGQLSEGGRGSSSS